MRINWDVELQIEADNVEQAHALIAEHLQPLEKVGIVVALMDSTPYDDQGCELPEAN